MYITASEVKDRLDQLRIIDIRKKEDVEGKGMVPTATNVFKEDLLKEPALYLNKEDEYVVYCNGGNSARVITQILRGQDYNVLSIEGGHRAWKEIE
jgi:rhodanese-related sulfurtransferase